MTSNKEIQKSKVTPEIFKKVAIAFFDDLEVIKKEGEDFALNPDAEPYLERLEEYKQAIEDIEDYLKEKIFEVGFAINPNFKGVQGDKVRIMARKYGAKYKFVLNKREKLEPFLTKKEWYNVDSDKVDQYLEEVGELPDGIYEADREPKVSISLKDNEDAS